MSEWQRLSDEEYRQSAERGLRALHAEGRITDVELADDLSRPTMRDLLDAMWRHLSTYKLPVISEVALHPDQSYELVRVQLARSDNAAAAAELLVWADTLTGVTADAWRVFDGEVVHLSARGRLPNGITIRVFAGVDFCPDTVGGDLPANGSRPVSLAELRSVAGGAS